MKRIIVAVIAAILLVPAGALANRPTRQHVKQYTVFYNLAARRLGARTPGRNIVHDGLATGHAPTDAQVVQSIHVLERMLHPAPAPAPTSTSAVSTTATASAPATTVSYSGSCSGNTPYPGGGQCWAIPYSIVLCESGAQNVMNTQGSGAAGYYQIMGGSTSWSKAEQDAQAAQIWNGGAGASAWTCAG